ncbi:phosphoribosyl-ATP diphosphatase [Halothiobacillus sp. DCM-1]|uniref:phosphoribosyl-ATP diphosphatase n=1 Tax=Halothiobacillus sp. DCM-1 TaxID=3112558 RepID=UPI003251CA08
MADSCPDDILGELMQVIRARRGSDPSASYVAQLFAKGRAKIAQKVGEEGVEAALAAVGGDTEEIIKELADLWFHSLVLLADAGLSHEQVLDELGRRFGLSGLAEKAARSRS